MLHMKQRHARDDIAFARRFFKMMKSVSKRELSFRTKFLECDGRRGERRSVLFGEWPVSITNQNREGEATCQWRNVKGITLHEWTSNGL